ncbi:MAG: iron ABC transporter permease [Chthoniobacterales bacterium]
MNRTAADDAARRDRRRLVLLAACLPLVLLAAAALGAVSIGPADLWKLLSGSADVPAVVRAVFWEIRVPRVLLAALVGGSLALAGAGVQGLFRNPLADPALIGVSAGAALGAVLCFFFGWEGLLGGWLLPLAAFAGGLLAVLILMSFHSGFAAGGTAKLILAGVALNAMAGSVLGFFLFSASDDALRSMTFWTLGSCASAQWPQVLVLLVFLAIGSFILRRHARALDALQLGEEQAAHLGVPVSRVRGETIAAAALLVGAATAFAGTIGFIGLVAPHMARLLLGGLHRFVLPAAVLLGAMLLVLADLGARTLTAPAELAVGILTAAIGGPFFLWLLRRPSSWSV